MEKLIISGKIFKIKGENTNINISGKETKEAYILSSPNVEIQKGSTSIALIGKSFSRNRVELNVPKDMALDIDCKRGDLSIQGVEQEIHVEIGPGNFSGKNNSGQLKLVMTVGNITVENHLSSIIIDASGGNILIGNCKDYVEIETTVGQITAMDLEKGLNIQSTSGDINLFRTKGIAKIHTKNGNIKVNKHSGPILVETKNGNIEMEGLDTIGINGETKNGSISAMLGRIYTNGNYQFKTSLGNINLLVPKNIKLELSTKRGKITYILPLKPLEMSGNRVVGTWGMPQSFIQGEVKNGNIKVEGIEDILEVQSFTKPEKGTEDLIQEIVDMIAQGRLKPEDGERIISAFKEGV